MIGGALIALREAPPHERAWTSGAEGEEATARALAERCPGAVVLHDRRVPGRPTNIDHIAIAASGVHVIDSKRYKGKKVSVHNPIFGSARLIIGGTDKTKLVQMLAGQVELVAAEVRFLPFQVPVQGAFCFVDADLPLFVVPTIRGLPCLGPPGLARRVNARGALEPEQINEVATLLATRLRAA